MLNYVIRDFKNVKIQEFGLTVGEIFDKATRKGMRVDEQNTNINGVIVGDEFFAITQDNINRTLTISNHVGNGNWLVAGIYSYNMQGFRINSNQAMYTFINWLNG